MVSASRSASASPASDPGADACAGPSGAGAATPPDAVCAVPAPRARTCLLPGAPPSARVSHLPQAAVLPRVFRRRPRESSRCASASAQLPRSPSRPSPCPGIAIPRFRPRRRAAPWRCASPATTRERKMTGLLCIPLKSGPRVGLAADLFSSGEAWIMHDALAEGRIIAASRHEDRLARRCLCSVLALPRYPDRNWQWMRCCSGVRSWSSRSRGDAWACRAVAGDASFRRYYRLAGCEPTRIAVFAPPDKERNLEFTRIAAHAARGRGVRPRGAGPRQRQRLPAAERFRRYPDAGRAR